MQHFLRTVIFSLCLVAGVAAGQSVAVTDYLGRSVELDAPATRVVSLMPSHSETLLALAAGGTLIGLDEASPGPEGTELPRVGNGFQPNIELIVSLEPDLVLTDQYSGVHAQLEELGVTVFAGTPETLEQVLEFNALLGELVGRQTEARQLTAEQEQRIASARQEAQGLSAPRVYVELDPTPFSAGPGSYVDDLLQIVGAVNVVPAEMGPWPMLSNEFVLSSQPDVVLLLDAPFGETEESFRARAGMDAMDARVVEVPAAAADLLSRPGPGLIQAIDWLFAQLNADAAGE